MGSSKSIDHYLFVIQSKTIFPKGKELNNYFAKILKALRNAV